LEQDQEEAEILLEAKEEATCVLVEFDPLNYDFETNPLEIEASALTSLDLQKQLGAVTLRRLRKRLASYVLLEFAMKALVGLVVGVFVVVVLGSVGARLRSFCDMFLFRPIFGLWYYIPVELNNPGVLFMGSIFHGTNTTIYDSINGTGVIDGMNGGANANIDISVINSGESTVTSTAGGESSASINTGGNSATIGGDISIYRNNENANIIQIYGGINISGDDSLIFYYLAKIFLYVTAANWTGYKFVLENYFFVLLDYVDGSDDISHYLKLYLTSNTYEPTLSLLAALFSFVVLSSLAFRFARDCVFNVLYRVSRVRLLFWICRARRDLKFGDEVTLDSDEFPWWLRETLVLDEN